MPVDPYREPALYDIEYAQQGDDVAFYIAEACTSGGPVLELGCGNGRITLPIARAGVEICGVDLSEAMLADLRGKLPHEMASVRARIDLHHGDFRSFRSERRFASVFWPFNALHHCESGDEVRAVLTLARQALLPGGTVIVDCYLPDRELYARDPNGKYEYRTFTDPRDGRTLTSWESGSWDDVTRVNTVIYVYQREDGVEEEIVLRLKMWEQHELAGFIRDAGLRPIWEASDFEGTPLGPRPLKWVMKLVPL